MLNFFHSLFVSPTPLSVAQRNLKESRIQLIKYQMEQEYMNQMVNYYTNVISRLSQTIDDQ